MAKKSAKKYYGEWEILSEIPSTDENEVTLSFAPETTKDGKEIPVPDIVIPMFNYDNVVSEEPMDWNTHRDKRLSPLFGEIIALYKKYKIFCGEKEHGAVPDYDYLNTMVHYQYTRARRKIYDAAMGGREPFFQTADQFEDLDTQK